MTIRQALTTYKDIEIELLLTHLLQRPKEFLFMEPQYVLQKTVLANVRKLAERRRKGEPIAYILGYKDFYGLRFTVNKNVLIPRPETEWLVDQALKEIARRRSSTGSGIPPISLLDLATGSGCIPISILTHLALSAKHSPVLITASDISPKALTVAKKNARLHQAHIQFVQSNLFKNIKPKFDIITANLPYVPIKTYKELYEGLKHEPGLAISDNTNNWTIYQQFFIQLKAHVNLGGIILLEIDQTSKAALTKMIKATLPRYTFTFFKDGANRWRYVIIRTPKPIKN